METPRPAATKLYRKLRNRMYRFAEKHSLTGFEAAGVMFTLATEVMASALVRDGLLQGGPDWAEEDAPGDSETVSELLRENKTLGSGLERMTDRCTQLSEANAQHRARIAQLEHETYQLTRRETQIKDFLDRLGLDLPGQEPQS